MNLNPTLERSRPGFASIANGLVKTIFESFYELSRGGRTDYYRSEPWRAVADNDSGQLFGAIKAIATLIRICPNRRSTRRTESIVQGMLVRIHSRLAHEIRSSGGSSLGEWLWTAEHFVEASHWDLSSEDFYRRYPELQPNFHIYAAGCGHLACEESGHVPQPDNTRPDFDADDGFPIRWGWNGSMFKEQLLTAWDDSRIGYSPPSHIRNPRRQLVLDIVDNRGGWLVNAARRIYAAAFLQTGHRGMAQVQIKDAYEALSDWVWEVHGRHLCLNRQEWIEASVSQSDADFYSMRKHLWCPKHGACGDLPLRNHKVLSATWHSPVDKEITEDLLAATDATYSRPSLYHMVYLDETTKQDLRGKWPCWAMTQPYGVGKPPTWSEVQDPDGPTIIDRVRLSAPRNWPELYRALKKLPNHSPTPSSSCSTSPSTMSDDPISGIPSPGGMNYSD